jgi:hypothetical protein
MIVFLFVLLSLFISAVVLSTVMFSNSVAEMRLEKKSKLEPQVGFISNKS